MSTFGYRLKEARKARGWSLTKAEQMLGVSVNRITSYENRGNIPHLDMAIKIAEGLGVSLDWLCGRSDREIKVVVKQRFIGQDQVKDIIRVIPKGDTHEVWIM